MVKAMNRRRVRLALLVIAIVGSALPGGGGRGAGRCRRGQSVTRIAGATRFETAAGVAEAALSRGASPSSMPSTTARTTGVPPRVRVQVAGRRPIPMTPPDRSSGGEEVRAAVRWYAEQYDIPVEVH